MLKFQINHKHGTEGEVRRYQVFGIVVKEGEIEETDQHQKIIGRCETDQREIAGTDQSEGEIENLHDHMYRERNSRKEIAAKKLG